MDVDVTTEVVIARPRQDVAKFAADPDNIPAWYANISVVEWITPRPLAVGTQLHFVARFLWRRLIYTYEVAEYIPAARLVMRTDGGEMTMETTYVWEDAPAGATRMVLRNRGTLGSSGALSRLVMRRVFEAGMRRANRKDLERLRKALEVRLTRPSVPF